MNERHSELNVIDPMYGNNLSTEFHITLILILKHRSGHFIPLLKDSQWSPP